MARAVLIGDLMLDEWVYTKSFRVSPETGVPVLSVKDKMQEIGGLGNVARHCLSLSSDIEIHLVSVLGNDYTGSVVKGKLKNLPIQNYVFASDLCKTTLKSRIYLDDIPINRIDEEESGGLDHSITDELINKFNLALPFCETVLLSDYGKGVITESLIKHISAKARKRGAITIIDAYLGTLEWISGIDIVKPNEKTWRHYISHFKSEHDAISSLFHRGIEKIIITLGSRGIRCIDLESDTYFPANRINAVDVTGAGDSIAAGLVVLLNDAESLFQIIPRLNEIGAKSVMQPRTVIKF